MAGVLGGPLYDSVRDLFADSLGNIYVTGGTESTDFFVTPGAYDTGFNGDMDVFVAKLSGDGDVLWATYLGGPAYDRAYAIEVGPDGSVYVGGRAGAGFPVTPGALQEEFSGGDISGPYSPQDGFVAKLSADGGELLYATYFGATDTPEEIVRDIDVWTDGSVVFAAGALSGVYSSEISAALGRGESIAKPGGKDIVVGRLSPDGGRLLWANWAGGSGREWGGPTVQMDDEGNAYMVTVSESDDALTTSGAFQSALAGGTDFYLTKYDPDGRLVFATYVGGSADEFVETHHLAIDPEGHPVVAAGTASGDFPTTAGAVQRVHAGNGGRSTGARSNYPGDVAVFRLSRDGRALLNSTLLGGRYGESAEGVAIGPDGRIFVTGGTFSDDFPVTAGAFQTNRSSSLDAFVALFSSDLTRLENSSYIGGSEPASGRTATAGPAGRFWFGGDVFAAAGGWPIIGTVMRGGGGEDGFFAAISFDPPDPTGRRP